jgi:pyruvate dehydrogenase E2 component (dihydrolipoamide acetyltransferase)
LAEIETDKATMDLESYDNGVLERILVQEGETVPIGQPIAIIGSGDGAAAGVGATQDTSTSTAGSPQASSQQGGNARQEAAPWQGQAMPLCARQSITCSASLRPAPDHTAQPPAARFACCDQIDPGPDLA